jgi:hypothetical protein
MQIIVMFPAGYWIIDIDYWLAISRYFFTYLPPDLQEFVLCMLDKTINIWFLSRIIELPL